MGNNAFLLLAVFAFFVNDAYAQCSLTPLKCNTTDDCCQSMNIYRQYQCLHGVCRYPCYSDGTKCAEDIDCCSEYCHNEKCIQRCRLSDRECEVDSDCCVGFCGRQGGKLLCQRPEPCIDLGGTCKSNDDCCVGDCSQMKKCAQTCTKINYKCTADSECCPKTYCVHGFCSNTPCRKEGAMCKKDVHCCRSVCSQGICNAPCLANLQYCLEDSECCDKLCIRHTCKFNCQIESGTCKIGEDCCYTNNCTNGTCGPNDQ